MVKNVYVLYEREIKENGLSSVIYILKSSRVKIKSTTPLNLALDCRNKGVDINLEEDEIKTLNTPEIEGDIYRRPVSANKINSFKEGYRLIQNMFDSRLKL